MKNKLNLFLKLFIFNFSKRMSYLGFDKYDTVEIIDEHFIVIEWRQLQMILSVTDDMINATKLVSSISSKRFSKWNETSDAKLFRERFPHLFQVRNTNNVFNCKDPNRVAGTYVDWTLIPVIVTWANTMKGYFLVNDFNDDLEKDTSGYIYIIQTKEYEGTDKYKIGRTWNPNHRFSSYGQDVKVIKCQKVGDMYKAESHIIHELNEGVTKPFKGKEWYECDLDEILYYYDEAVKLYPVNSLLELIKDPLYKS